ncbi:MAG: radical SAM protein [Alphaproteobacteria bacterium]|uniref:radical SAM/SPASM domain-containing protein n=1 Tax=Roseibium sp. TaxID=1936156 RepID=UPI003281A1A6
MKDWSKAEWVDPNLSWKPRKVSPLPSRLIMDHATKCNLRCPMCQVWGKAENDVQEAVKGVMDIDGARKILDEVSRAKPLVHSALYGEPLLMPDLKKRITDVKSRGMPMALNTNGLALTKDIANFLIEMKIEAIFFSIDSVTKETLKKIRGIDNLEKIERAVYRMLELRGEKTLPRIGVSFVVQDDNEHELDQFIEKWAHVVDCIRVSSLYESGTFRGLNPAEKRIPCPVIYETLVVHNTGDVSICCNDAYRFAIVGNALETSVDEVWQGEEFAKIRYYHETGQWDKVPFCTNCNAWQQFEYEEEIIDGLLIRRSPIMTYYNNIKRLDNWRNELSSGHRGKNAHLADSPPEG